MDKLVADIQQHGSITEVTVTWEPAGMLGFKGHGSSRCSKNDVYLAEIGETIALGRAIQDLGRKVEMLGHSQCVTKDEFRRANHLLERRRAAVRPALEEANLKLATEKLGSRGGLNG